MHHKIFSAIENLIFKVMLDINHFKKFIFDFNEKDEINVPEYLSIDYKNFLSSATGH